MPRKSTKNKEESAYQSLTEKETKTTQSKKIKTTKKKKIVKDKESIDQTNLNTPPKSIKNKTPRTVPSTITEQTIQETNKENKIESINATIDSNKKIKNKRKTKPERSEPPKPETIKTENEFDEKFVTTDTKNSRKKVQLKSKAVSEKTEEKSTVKTTKRQRIIRKPQEKKPTEEPMKPVLEEKQEQAKKTRAKITKEEPRVESKYEEAEEIEVLTTKDKPTPARPQVRYSDEDLEMFRKRILEVKNEALEELRMLRERLEDLNSYDIAEEGSIYSMHMAEQGSEIAEKEKVYAQIQRIHEYLKKLDEALKRIDDKTYGICRVCGILIAKERLLAVPITTLSASYKIHKKCPEDGIDRIEPVAK